jgi:hypothetical protein
MKKMIAAVVMSSALGLVPLMAQEKKEMPTKEGMPMTGEGMQGGMMMGRMKEMQPPGGDVVVGIGEFVLPNKELETAPQACLNRHLVKLIMTLSRMAISRRE